MQINKIRSYINFKQSSDKAPSPKVEEKQSIVNSVLLASAGLIGVGIASYFILRGKPSKSAQIGGNAISEFQQNFSQADKYNSDNIITKYQKLEIADKLVGLDDFYYYAAAKKNKIKTDTNIINLSGINNNKILGLAKLLTSSISEKFMHLKYRKNNFDLVQESLSSMPKNTFIFMENMENFLLDGGDLLPELNFFSTTQKSSVNISQKQLLDLTNDFEKYDILVKPPKRQDAEEIEADLSHIFHKNLDYNYTLNELLLNNNACVMNIENNINQSEIDRSLSFLADNLKTKYFNITRDKFDLDLPKVIDYQDSTGKKAIVYFDNLNDKDLFNQLSELDLVLVGKNLSNAHCNLNIKNKLNKNISLSIDQINKNINKIEKLYFKDSEQLKKNVLYPLVVKNADDAIAMPLKGIILKGKLDLTQKALQQISEISEIPIRIIDFTDFENGIQNLSKELENSNKPCLYDLINTEHVLCDYENNLDKIVLIGRFKNMIEGRMEQNSATAILRTNTPLTSFEQASIADHRFGVEIEARE